MDWPYNFPHPGDEIARRAARFRRLPAGERVRAVMDMVDVGNRLLGASPNRDVVLARIEAAEEAWREAHRRIFERHGH